MNDDATPTLNDPDVTETPSNDAGEKTYSVPHSAFETIKENARSKGRTEAEAAFTAKLESLGIKDVKTIDDAIARLKAAAPPKEEVSKETPPKTESKKDDDAGKKTGDGATLKRLVEAERLAATEKTRRERAEADAAAATKGAEDKAAESIARAKLEVVAVRAGVADSEYAITLLGRHVAALSEEDAAKFDPKSFFAGLRDTHPALFGTSPTKVTTGPTRSGPPAGDPAPETIDLRTMSPADYRKWRVKQGLKPI